jgi:hypothetical protein
MAEKIDVEALEIAIHLYDEPEASPAIRALVEAAKRELARQRDPAPVVGDAISSIEKIRSVLVKIASDSVKGFSHVSSSREDAPKFMPITTPIAVFKMIEKQEDHEREKGRVIADAYSKLGDVIKALRQIRRMHPEVFEERAKQSRELGARLVRVNNERIFLDELDHEAIGKPMKNMDFECGIFCEEKTND